MVERRRVECAICRPVSATLPCRAWSTPDLSGGQLCSERSEISRCWTTWRTDSHSRHREVTSVIWDTAGRLLPRAADLAGGFPASSGPNCFANVLGAAGAGAASQWTQREPFEEWLAERTRAVRGTQRDQQPGVVLVWRNHDGLAEHATVTIGAGYTLNKPSQGWFSPYLVWTVSETIAASRYRGAVLHRHLMTS